MTLNKLLCFSLGIMIFFVLGMDKGSAMIQAQDSLGGPYTADSATVLLLHFDGNLQNSSDLSADPQPSGNLSYVNMDSAGTLGQQLRIDNDSPQDSSWMTVADTAALDLTGSWTLELWINVFTYGSTQDDWRIGPRPIFKPGNPDEGCYCYSNYFFNIYGVEQNFNTGYYADESQTWIEVRSKSNLLHIGEWYHLTFIRDTSKNVILQMIHQTPEKKMTDDSDDLELVYFESQGYDSEDHPPRVNDQPLYIGASPQNDFSIGMLDGFLDEIRISNVVRNFSVPPIIKEVTELGNQQAGQPYEISTTIQTLGNANISSATLNYQVNDGSWNRMSMSEGAENQYSASIPSQSVGATVNYYVSAETEGGLTATNPATATTDSTFHQFAVWEDSTTVFHLDFDQDSDVPVDQSQFNADITLHGANNTATYTEGDEGSGDSAMEFNASDTTWLETTSAVHQLQNLTVDFKFYARDSVPATGTRMLAKGPASALYLSNYQVYFDPNGALRPAIFSGGNSLQPCGSYTGGCLVLNEPDQGRVEAENWYQVQIGIRAPDTSGTSEKDGVIFNRLIHMQSDSVVGAEVHYVNDGATRRSNPLMIGGTGGTKPYFNGLLDDIKVMNYVPQSYLPDSITTTSIQNPDELPQKVQLRQNYPNPFNPTTNISFNLPQAGDVNLAVYDVLGRRVATLIDGKRSAGQHTVSFDASRLSSGMYLYRLETGNVTKSRKMMLLK